MFYRSLTVLCSLRLPVIIKVLSYLSYLNFTKFVVWNQQVSVSEHYKRYSGRPIAVLSWWDHCSICRCMDKLTLQLYNSWWIIYRDDLQRYNFSSPQFRLLQLTEYILTTSKLVISTWLSFTTLAVISVQRTKYYLFIYLIYKGARPLILINKSRQRPCTPKWYALKMLLV